jgi:hypothetical protein
MSNLAVVNFAVGGSLVVSGKTTLGESLSSSSSASFQGLSTSNFNATGLSTFNNFLPTSIVTPTSLFQLTTKIYVDAQDGELNKKISDQKIYIDDADTALGTKITDQKTYTDDNISPINTFLFGGVSKSTGNYNISTGVSTTPELTTGNGNTVFGKYILSISPLCSNNTCFGQYILQNFNPSVNTGANVCFGGTIMQSLTTGISNVGVGNNVLGQMITSQQNTALGNLAGIRILGDFNTLLGANTGQAVGDAKTYSKSTALGYNAVISGSNQVVLGTVLETVICPNILSVASSISSSTLSVSSAIASTAVNIGSIINSGGISCALGSYFNGIVTSSLRVLNYESGATIQTRVFSSRNATLTNTVVNSTVATEIFGVNFTPKSSNSSIYATFDCYSNVSGTGTDTFQSRLLIGSTQCGFKDISFSNDNRNHSIILFPISGHCLNTVLTPIRVIVDASRIIASNNLNIQGPAWSLYITEIQN